VVRHRFVVAVAVLGTISDVVLLGVISSSSSYSYSITTFENENEYEYEYDEHDTPNLQNC